MHTDENSLAMRVDLTPEQRTADMRLTIDPGFVHYRLIQTVIPQRAFAALDQQIQEFPSDLPDHIRRRRIDHLYMQGLLLFCEYLPAPTLGDILARHKGQFFSSTDIVADTTRSQLADGDTIAVVAKLRGLRGGALVFEPLLMGSPWLSSKTDVDPFPGPEWYGRAFFENFIDDIDDFSSVRDVPNPSDFSIMRDTSGRPRR